MKAYKYLAAAASLLMASAMVSCTEENDPSSTGTTHIYVSSTSGVTSIFQGSEEVLTFSVTLSAPAVEATTLKVIAEGEAAAAVEFQPEYVVIAAGQTSAEFTLTPTGAELAQEANAVITVSDFDSEKFDVKETVTITVYPQVGAYELSETEKALVQAFKQEYGIDLTPWLGYVNLKGTIEFPGDGAREVFVEPGTINLEGVSVFRLSPESTPSNLMIDMTVNPMGMTEYLLDSFRKLTVDDKEYFAYEDEESNGDNLKFMQMLNWNANSVETFAVTLPGMTFDIDPATKKGTVNFVTEGEVYALDRQMNPLKDTEDNEITLNFTENRVNFDYYYTAWERQLDLFLANDPFIMEQTGYGTLAHPATYLGISNVLSDDWGMDEEEGMPNLYVEPKGTVDFEAGTMTFEFPFDHADQNGYSRVKVVYTIAK